MRLPAHSGTLALLTLCAVAATSVPSLAAISNLPVYPGATKLARQAHGAFATCGHSIGLVSYDSTADAKAVAQWYASKIQGAVVLDLSKTDSGTIDTEMEVFTPDGSQGAVVHRMTMTSAKLQAAAMSIGADKTGIGLETFDPPLGADYLGLEKRALSGDAASKSALTAKCPKEQ